MAVSACDSWPWIDRFKGSMIHSIIDWWADLSRPAKYGFCLSVLALNAALLLFAGTLWIFGWAVGGVLLVCTFLKVGEE